MGNKKRDEEAVTNPNADCQENEKREKKKTKVLLNNDDEISNSNSNNRIRSVNPGSIIDNTQSFELATRLAGQIARAATIFRNEVVIFDNQSISSESSVVTAGDTSDENESGTPFL